MWRLWCPVCPWDTAQHQPSQPLLAWARPHYLSLALKDEELTDLLLLVDIVLLQQFFVQPVRVLDTWYWVLHLHKGEIDHLSDAVSLGQAQVSVAFRSHCALFPPVLNLTCCRAAGIVMIFCMALPSRSM